jgi:hemerythrin HHE cation binding domain-containing protein
LPENRFAPRSLDFESLVRVLVEEHGLMKEGLGRLRESAERHDYHGAAAALKELDTIFRQHIADEESQILRLLIHELGVKGAEEEIRVFQQHRPIHQLMETVAELASKSAIELEKEQAKLSSLFLEHTALEEGRVFPHALACNEAGRKRSAPGEES